MSDKVKYTTVWEPLPGPQTFLITCPVFETFFGGSRGGGKSDGVLGEWATHAQEYGENAIGLCVRRERTQLTELIERSKILYFPLGAKFNEQDKMWRFSNGARLRFAYLENDKDAESYQGHSYTRILVEELGGFPTPDPIIKLMATLRSGTGVPCRFIATGNPGGPGHNWIKQRYIDPAPGGFKIIKTNTKDPFTGTDITKERVFIPSTIQDNKYTNTPEYIGNLQLSGGPELVKAWLMGDWKVTLGAYYPEWDVTRHVIKTFRIPNHWTRFMSMDWGSASPFSVGWWAVVPDGYNSNLDVPSEVWKLYQKDDERLYFPPGSIIRYKEWYGSKTVSVNSIKEGTNKGIKLTAEQVAEGIMERELTEPKNQDLRPDIAYRVADPKMFSWDSGPSISERMGNPPYNIVLQKADNKRTQRTGAMGGWDILRQRLVGEEGVPTIFFMDNCIDAIRTLPALQHDDKKLEDVDSSGEDHAPDEIRYACMSRPYSKAPSVKDNMTRMARIFNSNMNNGIVIKDDFDFKRESSFNQQRIA